MMALIIGTVIVGLMFISFWIVVGAMFLFSTVFMTGLLAGFTWIVLVIAYIFLLKFQHFYSQLLDQGLSLSSFTLFTPSSGLKPGKA